MVPLIFDAIGSHFSIELEAKAVPERKKERKKEFA
jgi:hypothetical protein